MTYDHLLAPGRIGSMELRNRIVRSPMETMYGTPDGLGPEMHGVTSLGPSVIPSYLTGRPSRGGDEGAGRGDPRPVPRGRRARARGRRRRRLREIGLIRGAVADATAALAQPR